MLDPARIGPPLFLACIVLEMWLAHHSARVVYEVRDTATNLVMGLGALAFGAAFSFTAIALAGALAPYRIWDIGWSLGACVVCFVLEDLVYYAFHRVSHRVRWIWCDHLNHHTSQYFNLSTALRQSWSLHLTPAILFKAPLLLLGFPLPMILFVHAWNQIYQFWIHTETIGRLPRWFEFVFNTPSHHRVHHARNPEYLDSNFGGTLIVWDRLFGTFVEERVEIRPRYGIVRNIASFNPLRVAYHGWFDMLADLRRARTLGEAGRYVFGPPGWSPTAPQTTEILRRRIETSLSAGQAPGQIDSTPAIAPPVAKGPPSSDARP